MLIGIVTLVFFYMGTGIKRGLQSLVKITADQVGNQQNADQDFNDTSGYMEGSNTMGQINNNKEVTEAGYISNITNSTVYIANASVNEYSDIVTNSITNGGFAPGI